VPASIASSASPGRARASPAADHAIHEALELTGPAPPCTTEVAAALTLLPNGFEAHHRRRRAGLHHGEAPWRGRRMSMDDLLVLPRVASEL
jgi:hypothetical protein